jgi:acetyltransferase
MIDLRQMLNPKTIALIGATDREGSVGKILLGNLLFSKERKVIPVNPGRKRILDMKCYPGVASVKDKIDLAVIATPAPTVPREVEACGKAGIRGVLIISAGFREAGPEGEKLEQEVSAIRSRYGMRIIGPTSLGFIRPHIGLNATFLRANPEKGNVAFISQSGGFGRALIDWGVDSHIGFSMFFSLGSMIDIDFGELIDFLGSDPHTKSIILYVEESIGDVKKFISAARGFARNKPIVLLRPIPAVREREPSFTHTGEMAGSDEVSDAVFKRVGVVRVKAAVDLYNTAGVLYARNLPKGPRLLIITNTAGGAIMAHNMVLKMGGEVAELSEGSVESLKQSISSWRNEHGYLDLGRDADVDRYVAALRTGLADAGVDGILLIFAPYGLVDSGEFAKSVAQLAREASKPVLTNWLGSSEVREAREILRKNNIPTYWTPEEAVRTYLYMYRYERNLKLLYETPAELPVDQAPPKNNLKALIRKAAAKGRTVLTEEESMRFLVTYGIPIVRTYAVKGVEEAVVAARQTGYPLVLKIISPDITFKSDVGGVETGISSDEELRNEYGRLMERVQQNSPSAVITGMTLQRMVEEIDYQIILGAKKDKDFGAVILFGMGGTGVEILNDFSIGIPPLNQALARQLIEETNIYRLLKGYRGKPPANLQQLEQIIVAFSNLVMDFPEIGEMDINPVALTHGKAFALDAKIVIDRKGLDPASPYPHLIITPYPTKYIVNWRFSDGQEVLLRPIRPEDEPLEHEMLTSLSEESLRERFFYAIRNIPHEMHVRFCNIDYDREMAIVAEVRDKGKRRLAGIGRLIIEPDGKSGEFAVVIHDDYHGKGLGYKLVDMIIGIGQEKGLEECYGFVQADNTKMLKLCSKLGFTIEQMPERMNRVSLALR